MVTFAGGFVGGDFLDIEILRRDLDATADTWQFSGDQGRLNGCGEVEVHAIAAVVAV